jgi:NAD(P)-dependent dehydrogenase (short-subunit alcohol dehydrogenase family)
MPASKKKVVLVTGGATGIGASVARLAASAGYHVAINYRSRDTEAKEIVAEIERGGGRAVAIAADVAAEKDVIRMFLEVDRILGPLDALVNSAGVGGGKYLTADFDAAALERLFAVNVVGLMLCCREAAKRMSTRRGGSGGSIVNVSSMAGTIGGRAAKSHYAASKAAVDSFTVGFAKETGAEGIRVNAVRPGVTRTDMTAEMLADPAVRADIEATIPMRRPGTVDEIARPILWLLSDEASFVSGARLDASGGGFVIGRPAD